jgi:hypothetical protein
MKRYWLIGGLINSYMERNYIFLYALFCTVIMCCSCEPEQTGERVIYIQNEFLKAGVLPGVGGRLVYLARPGEENLLKSDSALWFEPERDFLEPTPDAGFKAYNGHIIWPGPQTEWWMHQNLNPDRRDRKAIWPPDPYLIYTPSRIAEHTEASILLYGEESPISGVRIDKRYTLSGNSIRIDVTMVNTSDKPVAWDIWSNTRFEVNTGFFVPYCEEGILRLESEESKNTDRLDYHIRDGAFAFVPTPPGSGKERRYSKVFLHPRKGVMVAVRDSTMMVMNFPYESEEKIHPDESFVEVYQMITSDGSGDLLELEHHSAYTRLQPGESFELSETWNVYDYPGDPDLSEYLAYFSKLTN